MTFDIVIVSNAHSKKHRILTENAVRTALGAKTSHTINVIVVEQTDATYEGATTVRYDFDFNYNKCLNYGATFGTGEYILFCNNDLIFYDWYSDRLLDAFKMGYKSLSPYCPRYHRKLQRGSHLYEGYVIQHHIAGWCIATERKMIEGIGGFDEAVAFWFSDNLYVDQLRHHNIKHALVCNAIVEHIDMGSATLKGSKRGNEYTYGQRALYEEAKKKYYGKRKQGKS